MQSPVALQAQNFLSCLCADEMDAPILAPADMTSPAGPHAANFRVKARRVPSARSVVEHHLWHTTDSLWNRVTGGVNPSEARLTCCHGTQHSGMHTASCGWVRSILRRASQYCSEKRFVLTNESLQHATPDSSSFTSSAVMSLGC